MRNYLEFCFWVILSIFFLSGVSCKAGSFPNENAVFSASIKTVQLYRQGFELSSPIITLNSGERLKLSFDDLDADNKRYKYTIVHCEADWSLSSELSVSDYISGYTEEFIENYSGSYNTTVLYTHYTAVFPSSNMSPKISGNYMLLVYDDEPSKLAFTRRFMVAEATAVGITGKISQPSRFDYRNSGQQIDFQVELHSFPVSDVSREISVVVQQNERWDNALRQIQPRFIRGNVLDYTYDDNNVFSAGNEFRSFDTKSLLYQSERIGRISYDTTYQVVLLPDQPRTYKNYTFDQEINGRFFIKNEEHAQDSEIEADYAWIHFFLPFPAMPSNGSMYLMGALTDWKLDQSGKMNYNFNRKGFEKNLFMKQGYYNYIYVFLENGKKMADESLIEGSHWETENDYTIYVYFHETGEQYDRLIATRELNSHVK